MPQGNVDIKFTSQLHALLFTSISKEIINQIGEEKGEQLIRKAVQKYFCKEIDAALVNGFNPDLEIQVNSTQTNGDKLCDFVFKDAKITFLKTLGLLYKKRIKPGADVIMSWEYHSGHLSKTFSEVIKQELGVVADKIMKSALIDFVKFSSKDHIAVITKYENTDFDQLP